MRLDRRQWLAGVAAMAVPVPVPVPVHTGARVCAPVLERLMAGYLARGVPGVSMALADRHGILWRGATGVSRPGHRGALRTDHLLGIGSITKTFVALIVLQLWTEGRLSLDATPAQLLDDDAIAEIANSDIATLAHLLDHTSGIPSWEEEPAWIRAGRGVDFDPKRIWRPDDTLSYVRGRSALFPPGQGWSYSNTNHTLLGLVIEKITRAPLAHSFRDRIFARAGLTGIYLDGFDDYDRRWLSGSAHVADEAYITAAGGLNPRFAQLSDGLVDTSGASLSCEWAAGGLVARADMLARYAVALRDGRLLNRAGMAKFYSFNDHDYGRSIGRIRFGGGYAIGHTGGVLGYSARMFWFDDADLAVAMLFNLGTMHAKKPNRWFGADDLPRVLKTVRAAMEAR